MKNIYIYGLIDPTSNTIRYIGATNDMNIRYPRHLNPSPQDKTKRANWLRGLLGQNLKPYLSLLEIVPLENATKAEAKWVEYYKNNDLYNFFPTVPYVTKRGKTEQISIRVERLSIDKLKTIAEMTGLKYQTIIKKWIKEKIDEHF